MQEIKDGVTLNFNSEELNYLMRIGNNLTRDYVMQRVYGEETGLIEIDIKRAMMNKPQVLFYCDRRACENCTNPNYDTSKGCCNFTENPEHAEYFARLNGGYYERKNSK